jgi:membrane protein YdbS with pleckstrin-like domain
MPLFVVRRHPLWLALALAVRALPAVALLAVFEAVGLRSGLVVVAIVAAAALWAILTWARWRAESLTVAARVMTFRRGVFVRSCKVVHAEAVQDVSTEQSLPGLFLGYGAVEISTWSGGHERLDAVPDPVGVRDRLVRLHLDELTGG